MYNAENFNGVQVMFMITFPFYCIKEDMKIPDENHRHTQVLLNLTEEEQNDKVGVHILHALHSGVDYRCWHGIVYQVYVYLKL